MNGAVGCVVWLVLWLPACTRASFLDGEELELLMKQTDSGRLDLPADYQVQDNEEFEFVVVGAGAAGCAVAAGLARAGRKVLLLEAGGPPSRRSQIPGIALALLGSSEDWQYDTVPNNVSCLSARGGRCRASRGRALGGSTAIHHMMYVRGSPADYELGLPGWTWDLFKPFFLRYEALRDLHLYPPSSKPHHNTTGYVSVRFCADPENPWRSRLVEGFEKLGFPFNPDVNAESQIGVTRVATFTAGGERESTASAYLTRGDVKRTLRVAVNTRVTGVLFDEGNVARGVTAVRGSGGGALAVRATRGVVLSAGALATPQLLLLAGVGPAPQLARLGIAPRAPAPVGEELSDHVLPMMFIRVKNNFLEKLRLAGTFASSPVRYIKSRDGPLASIGLTDTTAFVNTSCYDFEAKRLLNFGPECELPTTQFIYAYIPQGGITVDGSLFQRATSLSDAVTRQLAHVSSGSALVVASPVVLAPASRGWVRLASADPLAAPRVFPNYLSDARDVDEMLRAITILEHLVDTPALRGAALVRPALPGCPQAGAGGPGRRRYWSCYVRHMTFSGFHAAGSCALGRVLDERLRVRGVRALHVADLSALPAAPRGNAAAAAIALGERLAHFLLTDYPGTEKVAV